jgi:pilus assembly protein CpaE
MAQGTILVVDDSPLATKIMSTLFTREGYEVLTAGSGEEALEHLGRVTPDLVVTDIMMPGIDGYELCHQIRVRPHLRGIPVLAITTVNELEAKLRGVEVGVDDFVPKNTPTQELLARVEALLTRRGQSDSLPPPSPDAPRRTGRVVAFFSLKGGCGRTTLATNSALLLARLSGDTVGLLDLALEQGSAELFLDVIPRVDLGTLAGDEVAPEALTADEVRRLVTMHPGGVALLGAPRYPEDAERVSPDLTTAALAAMTGAFGLVVVDTPCSFNEHVLRVLESADLVVLVATSDLTGAKATSTTLRIFQDLKIPDQRLVVVLNAPNGQSSIDRDGLGRAIRVPVDVVVPYDASFIEAVNAGEPLVLRTEPRPTPAQVALAELADHIAERLAAVDRRSPG